MRRCRCSNEQSHVADQLFSAHRRPTGGSNTASGAGALFYNDSGSWNTASGDNALAFNNTGYNNTASGFQALFNNTTGINNTAALGSGAIVNASNKIRLGDTNVTVIEAQGDFHAAGPGKGIILKSQSGAICKRLFIDDTGTLLTASVACP